MMNAVRQRAESYDEWASRVTEVMEAKLDKKRGEFFYLNTFAEALLVCVGI